MNTIVVNIFGGPGAGKSTIAAGVFYHLKKDGGKAELVREYVKKWAWEGILPNKLDQIYITGKQTKAEHMLYGRVNTVVTDCPLLMGVFYDAKYNNLRTTEVAVDHFLDQTANITRLNFIAARCKDFDPDGRFCSEEAALETDTELLAFLKEKGVASIKLHGTIEQQVEQIVKVVNKMKVT